MQSIKNLLKIQQKDLESNPILNGKHVRQGLVWNRLFRMGHPYDVIKWDIRTARISKGSGEVVFEQENIEVPDFWSQTATDIVASKYFRGRPDAPERERSAKQMVDRGAAVVSGWGWKDGYFATEEDYQNFNLDLKWLLINQYAAFNSPVWFNVGVHEKPQCSACFILSVEDNMASILEWYQTEGWIFKGGSGSGLNLSKLRSSKEPLSKGGHSSGPVSFMKGADGVANSIRSGGTTRRAAKMVVLNVDHPDIKDFIYCKKNIEDMTKALEASGIVASIEGELFNPYTLLPYQNANNSVRVTDEFMLAVERDDWWDLKAATTGVTIERVKAREVMNWMADAAWHSADPGIQFDTVTNHWHTCPNTGPITASNPCSEYVHLDNSACNLASINLLKFLRSDGSFDVELFKKAVDTLITAQDMLVDNSSYPTEKIGQNARDYRELGLGYANLGALLMMLGLPYDSDEGRAFAGLVTSVLGGEAYTMSARLADICGPFNGYHKNKEPMLRVIRQHKEAAENLLEQVDQAGLGAIHRDLKNAALEVWQDASAIGQNFGFRNSQATVLAPTGTISFLMDCDTTGIEPELALVRYKKLVGGGTIKLVNNQVPNSLRNLGYSEDVVQNITQYILQTETIEGAPGLEEKHLPVFDCSFKATKGTRSIHYTGHLKMMAAAQPFISGAISKTANLPASATKEEMFDAFMMSWKLGLKAVAFYRDGSKSVQPLNVSNKDNLPAGKAGKLVEKVNGYTRVKLPDERPSITHKFSVANYEGYITVGLYPDTKKPAETFITIAKEGSTISGLFDTIATLISLNLQSGIPLKNLIRKFKDSRFEPSGFTTNEEIPIAKSLIDYIFRYLGVKFLSAEDKEEIFGTPHVEMETALDTAVEVEVPIKIGGIKTEMEPTVPMAELVSYASQPESQSDAPICPECGSMTFRAGSCFTCPNCFATTGVCN